MQMQVEMPAEKEAPLIFLYYSIRGQMQPLRNLLCYLQLPFYDVHLDQIEKEKKNLPAEILKQISKVKIDRSQLPALIHGELFMEGNHVIAPYLLFRFERKELFGRTIFIRTRVQQILDVYYTKQPQWMAKMMEMMQKCSNMSEAQFNKFVVTWFDAYFPSTKYVKEICQYIDKQAKPSFIFGELTLVDFFFMECCFYLNGFYNHPERINHQSLKEWERSKDNFLDKPNAYYLGVCSEYQKMIKSQPWYVKNQDQLQSFTMICKLMSSTLSKSLQKFWQGNPKMVA